jgi:hypothetical protein
VWDNLRDAGELREALLAVPAGLVKSRPGLYESICSSISSDLLVWPYGSASPDFDLLKEAARDDLNFRVVRTEGNILVARYDYHLLNSLSPQLADCLYGYDYDSADCFRKVHGLLDLFLLLLGPDEMGVYAIAGRQAVLNKIFRGFDSVEIEYVKWTPSQNSVGG